MKKINILILSGLLTYPFINATPTIKKSTVVFEKWIKCQHVMQDRLPTDMIPSLNDAYLKQFKTYYENNIPALKPATNFLTLLSAGQINAHGYQFQATMPAAMHNNMSTIYSLLEKNTQDFVNALRNNQLGSPEINFLEEHSHHDMTVEKHKALSRMLFKQENAFREDEYLFGMANRLFEYCFQEKTFPHYQALLNNYSDYPIVRFLHSTLWFHLVGDGWMHWHKDCLDALQDQATQGNRIVYPAGGADWHMLLQNGIYNITIIDPFLPSQQRYYSEGWDWLVRSNEADGGINDEIHFYPPSRHLVLKRTSFSEGDVFYAKLSTGEIATLKKSITTWTVIDGNTDATLGTVIIDRRFTKQEDFTQEPDKTIVMSYDELVYAVAPEMFQGWGINPDMIAKDQMIMVKQLRNPVSTAMLKNMRIAIATNLSNVKFIHFASDPS